MLLTCKVEEKGKNVEDEGKDVEKSYTYSDLKDLQSKLTLVAGEQQTQNRDTIRQFNNASYIK